MFCNSFGHNHQNCTSGYRMIRINLKNPKVKKVEFYSDMDQWAEGRVMQVESEKGGEKVYYLAVQFSKLGKHEFKFKIDGREWITSDLYQKI